MEFGVAPTEHRPPQDAQRRDRIFRIGDDPQTKPEHREIFPAVAALAARYVARQADGIQGIRIVRKAAGIPGDDHEIFGTTGGRLMGVAAGHGEPVVDRTPDEPCDRLRLGVDLPRANPQLPQAREAAGHGG